MFMGDGMWIEFHSSLRDHPKVVRGAKQLGIPKAHFIGHLGTFWLWCLSVTPDGELTGFDDEDLEIGAEWEGEPGAFISVLRDRKLIDIVDEKTYVHDWDIYAEHLKARKRKRDERARKRSQDSAGFPGMSRDVTGQCRISGHVTQTDQNRPDQNRPDQNIKSESEDVRRVFAFWVEEFWSGKGPEPKLDRNRRGKIAGRLKDGFTVEDLCNAIRGCKSSPFHMGENDDGKRHNSVDLIFRNREKTEGFIAMHLNPKSGNRKGPAKPTPPEEWTEEDLDDDTEKILSGGGWEEYERRKREGIPI